MPRIHRTRKPTGWRKRPLTGCLKRAALCFYLECVECRFEIPSSIEIRRQPKLRHGDDDSEVAKSLFDWIERESFNDYEAEVALYLDRHPEVLWWYQNKVGRDNFAIQGFRKNRILPILSCRTAKTKSQWRGWSWSKAKANTSCGNPDTKYKQKIADCFTKIGKQVSWQKLGEGFDRQQFRFQILDEGLYESWRDELNKMISA